jgi:hypothetical protein
MMHVSNFLKNIKCYFLLFLFLIVSAKGALAQQLDYKIEFEGFADNREYFSKWIEPQTIFGERAEFQVGVKADSNNSLYFGLSHTYEFGGEKSLLAPQLYAYYEGEVNGFQFNIGAFPRDDKVKHPLILLSDTLHYFRPAIEGAFLNVNKNWGYQNLWIDWLSRQTQENYEVFLAGLSGLLKTNTLYFNYHLIMQHLAGTASKDIEHNLQDNGGLVSLLGINLSENIFLDTLSISSGYTMSYDRKRGLYGLRYFHGSISNLEASYKGHGISAWYYNGEGQVQVIGDQFYTAPNYFRLNTFITPINNRFVTARFTFAFHFVPGELDFSQMFRLNFKLDNF